MDEESTDLGKESSACSTLPSLVTHLYSYCNLTSRALNLCSNLRGSIPAAVSALTALEVLDLTSNQLSGSIPDAIRACTALSVLILTDNLLEGTIPTSLGVLTNLTAVCLDENLLTGSIPSALGQLGGLAYVL